jgi:hypothetical protein
MLSINWKREIYQFFQFLIFFLYCSTERKTLFWIENQNWFGRSESWWNCVPTAESNVGWVGDYVPCDFSNLWLEPYFFSQSNGVWEGEEKSKRIPGTTASTNARQQRIKKSVFNYGPYRVSRGWAFLGEVYFLVPLESAQLLETEGNHCRGKTTLGL